MLFACPMYSNMHLVSPMRRIAHGASLMTLTVHWQGLMRLAALRLTALGACLMQPLMRLLSPQPRR